MWNHFVIAIPKIIQTFRVYRVMFEDMLGILGLHSTSIISMMTCLRKCLKVTNILIPFWGGQQYLGGWCNALSRADCSFPPLACFLVGFSFFFEPQRRVTFWVKTGTLVDSTICCNKNLNFLPPCSDDWLFVIDLPTAECSGI